MSSRGVRSFNGLVCAFLPTATELISRQLAERVMYDERMLIFLGGVFCTGHDRYPVGKPGMRMPREWLGRMISPPLATDPITE